MAHLSKIPLNDDKSHEFLKQSGFVNIESICYDSVWTNTNHTLYIPPYMRITTREQLYAIIFSGGYDQGLKNGRNEIAAKLKNKAEQFVTDLLK